MITKTTKDCAIIFTIPKDEINKIDFALCAQPKETIDSYYNRQEVKPDLICNGGFFNMSNGQTIFNYKDENKWVSQAESYQEGMGIKNGSALEFGESTNPEYKDFVSAYPVFVKDGKEVSSALASELNYRAKRTILAYDKNNIYLILVDSPGLTFKMIKTMLVNDLKVDYAINLDGGGSTRCLYNGSLAIGGTYNRPVDNVVCFYMKPAEKIIYRVQVGAFSKKANAESLQSAIRKLPDTIGAGYAKAYVKLINNLYKVQVGAFSKKENAQRVLDDLKSKGYNGFIAK